MDKAPDWLTQAAKTTVAERDARTERVARNLAEKLLPHFAVTTLDDQETPQPVAFDPANDAFSGGLATILTADTAIEPGVPEQDLNPQLVVGCVVHSERPDGETEPRLKTFVVDLTPEFYTALLSGFMSAAQKTEGFRDRLVAMIAEQEGITSEQLLQRWEDEEDEG